MFLAPFNRPLDPLPDTLSRHDGQKQILVNFLILKKKYVRISVEKMRLDLAFSRRRGRQPSRRGCQPTIMPKFSKTPHEIETSMYSSRMRTVRLLPVSSSMHCCWGGGVCSWGYPSMQWGRTPHPPGTEFLTHASENITLPQLR